MLPQDLDGILIRPVVKDSAEEIDISFDDGLLRQEVVGHELDAAGQVGRCLGRRDDGLEVLNYARHQRELVGDGEGCEALRSFYLVRLQWSTIPPENFNHAGFD